MIILIYPVIPHTKVERLKWYAEHFPRMQQRYLIDIATNPGRSVIDLNERIIAVMAILEKGIDSAYEVRPLLDLLGNENDYPLTQGTTHEKENNALLRGDTAIALAKYGVNTDEFKEILLNILKSIIRDPVFIAKDTPTTYFMNFACAIYMADKDSIINELVMKAYTKQDELDKYIRDNVK